MTEHKVTIEKANVGVVEVYRARCSCAHWNIELAEFRPEFDYKIAEHLNDFAALPWEPITNENAEVWVLEVIDYGGSKIVGIYTTEESANKQKALENQEANIFEITKYRLNEVSLNWKL